MAWPKRHDYEHTYHHVFTRGPNQWNIFLDELDYQFFERSLLMLHERYKIEVVAYCLMGNHMHLLLYCRQGGLSDALRDLKSRYARYFNKAKRRTGPAYRERFGSKLITGEAQFLDTVRYIHRNPLDLDPANDLVSYPWSSHALYLGLRAWPPWFNPRIALNAFGDRYQAAIDTQRPSDKVVAIRPSKVVTIPGIVTTCEPVTLARIRRVVAQVAEVELAQVQRHQRNGLLGLCTVIALDDAGFTAAEVADPFDYRTAGAVRTSASRSRKRLAQDVALDAIYQQAKAQLAMRAAA